MREVDVATQGLQAPKLGVGQKLQGIHGETIREATNIDLHHMGKVTKWAHGHFGRVTCTGWDSLRAAGRGAFFGFAFLLDHGG